MRGAQLKIPRKPRRWTLEQLSKSSKLSRPYLFRLEGGALEPLLPTLLRVRGLPLRRLRDGEANSPSPGTVVRASGSGSRQTNGLPSRAVSGSGELNVLQAVEASLLPSRHARGSNCCGEKRIYVLSGCLKRILERSQQLLEAGDPAHFDAPVPLRLAALENSAAELVCAAETNFHQFLAAARHNHKMHSAALTAFSSAPGRPVVATYSPGLEVEFEQ